MPALTLNHPLPIPRLPAGLNPDSADSMRAFARTHHFPSASIDGKYLFAFVDELERFTSVRLRHGLASHRRPPTLHRCAGGLHVLELDAPFVNRIEYRFAATDDAGNETLGVDQLNRSTVSDPFAVRSVIASSTYAAPEHVRDPMPQARGNLHAIEIGGPIGKPWPGWVWSPPGVKSDQMLPVVIFLDGSDWLTMASARNILENLVQRGAILPCRAVFLKPASRNEEYAAIPATADFLADGLQRALAAMIPLPHEARFRIAVGCSLGGLCLLHAHFTNAAHSPFGGLILQSGSFFQPHTDSMESSFPWFDAICAFVERALGSADRSVPRIPMHMTAGSGEENLVNNTVMAEALTRQNFAVTFHRQPDAHNWTCWRDSVGEGLMRLLRP